MPAPLTNSPMPQGMFDGPIPGANYTTDQKNFPWHRPPEFDNLDQAIEAVMEKVTSEDGSPSVLTLLNNGATCADLAFMSVMNGVMMGKWTTDYAVLMAGPVANIFWLMAKGYGIKAKLGVTDKPKGISNAYMKALKQTEKSVDTQKAISAGEKVASALEGSSGGFMSPPKPNNKEIQEKMMGQTDQETPQENQGEAQ